MSDETIASSLLRQEGPQQEQRPIKQLRDVLSMLCNYIWTKNLRPGEHLWSIPVDQRRDFDCILSDAINELEQFRSAASKPYPSDLLARLMDYHDQVLKGFRHISRVEEADLIQAAIDGLRQPEKEEQERDTLEMWRTAALEKDRTRQAIRDRIAAGENQMDIADDFNVPLAFISHLAQWQLFGDHPVPPAEGEK